MPLQVSKTDDACSSSVDLLHHPNLQYMSAINRCLRREVHEMSSSSDKSIRESKRAREKQESPAARDKENDKINLSPLYHFTSKYI